MKPYQSLSENQSKDAPETKIIKLRDELVTKKSKPQAQDVLDTNLAGKVARDAPETKKARLRDELDTKHRNRESHQDVCMNRKALKQYLELLSYSGVEALLKTNDVKADTVVNKNEEQAIPEQKKTFDTVHKEAVPRRSGDINATPKISSIQSKEQVTKKQIDVASETEKGNRVSSSSDKQEQLESNRRKYCNCNKCVLHQNRINFVYGEGDADAKLMFIGEGPGSQENKMGQPFVGRAGQLLTKMLAAINLKREEVYITNIVKCQPPENRNPLPDEVTNCLPYLREQIEIIQPELIVLLGKVAASSLLGSNDTLGQLRLERHSLSGIETYVTYHPAALLRNPSFKKLSWVDLQKYRDILLTKSSSGMSLLQT